MALKTNLSVVIDMGTSKMTAMAGIKNNEGKLEIAAMAVIPSKGIKRGLVFNIDEAAQAVRQLLDKLEDEANERIDVVHVAFATQHVKVFDYQGSRYTSGEGMVLKTDVDELENEARNVTLDPQYSILHVLPHTFIVDDEVIGVNPVGIAGRKIEAQYKIVAVPESHLVNIRRVLEKAGAEAGTICLGTIALSEAVLSSEEQEMGAIMLDIGAGATKMAVYHDGSMVHTVIIPFGGNVITGDIREGCSIHPRWAEQLKVQYGQAMGDFADEQKVVTIPGHNGWEPKEISFKSLAFIIQARLEEIIDNIFYQIEKSGIHSQLGSGIVVTGGTANLANIIALVKFRTGLDARLAMPVLHTANKTREVKDQDFYVALGLLNIVAENANAPVKEKRKKEKKKKEGGFSPWLKNVVQGVLDYVDDDEDLDLKN